MNKYGSSVEVLIKEMEEEIGGKLTNQQNETVYQCMLLGLTNYETKMVIRCNAAPRKRLYILASLMDDFDRDFIEQHLVPENSLEKIKQMRFDYSLKYFKENDEEYQKLKYEIGKLEEELESYYKLSAAQGEANKRIQNELENYKNDKISFEDQKQQLNLEITERKEEIRKLNNELSKQRIPEKVKEIKTIKKSFERPKTIKGKINYLMGGELESIEDIITDERTFEESTEKATKSICGDIIEIMCNPEFSIEQIRELEQASIDGLSYVEIKKIANPKLRASMMSELRRFMCTQKCIKFTSIESVEDVDEIQEAMGATEINDEENFGTE